MKAYGPCSPGDVRYSVQGSRGLELPGPRLPQNPMGLLIISPWESLGLPTWLLSALMYEHLEQASKLLLCYSRLSTLAGKRCHKQSHSVPLTGKQLVPTHSVVSLYTHSFTIVWQLT